MSLTIINTMWVFIASILVFIMHAGFAMVEVGFTRSQNAIAIVMKNFVTIAIGVLCYFFIGYGLMFGEDFYGLIGLSGFALANVPSEISGISFYAFFLFQAIFAATCATIVSGAMAERTSFLAYTIFCTVATVFIYPLIGHWVWGGGFLSSFGFRDFAGGTVVHGVGGCCALIGAYLVGPRSGRFTKKDDHEFQGHNIPLGALGVLILWFGWFGFNPGSTLDITSPATIHAAITTLLAASSGTLFTLFYSVMKHKKPDVSLTLNGALAGLVGITAGANMVDFMGALVIGATSGILMATFQELMDHRFKIDDPVGAVAVHGICGFFGTFAIGLFAVDGGLFYGGGITLLGIQALGILLCAATAIALSYVTFKLLDMTCGLRKEHDSSHDASLAPCHPNTPLAE